MDAFQLMQFIITEKQSINLTYYNDTKKMAHDSQIVRGKENLKLRILHLIKHTN